MIDAEWIRKKNDWSLRTFGPGDRANGVVAHIRKELCEIEAKPDDLSEWVDVILLALDGAARQGFTPDEIIIGILEKQNVNMSRDWPDFNAHTEGEPIEHIRQTE